MIVARLFKEFYDSEKAGGMVLLACTVISLIITNTVLGDPYTKFWHSHINLSFASVDLNYPVEMWINDGLMSIFFLLVGLEIERELFIGELNEPKNALLPIAAAIGGILLPATIHFLFNVGTPYQQGFGIPMATDIAFALGMLALIGSRIPIALRVFLAALAIIDDLGAILVIAIFYSHGISWVYLLSAIGIFFGLWIMGRYKVDKLILYLVPGIVMWYCMLKSGVHPTISGVLLAFAIPFTKDENTCPSRRLQHLLHKPAAFIILPLFALANTGILIPAGWLDQLAGNNNIGIILGLLVGKPVGILLFCFLLTRLKGVSLPTGVTWWHVVGVGFLAGIGFTMSIFIANLAFEDAAVVHFSKISILVGSAISCVFGLAVLYFASPKNPGTITPE